MRQYAPLPVRQILLLACFAIFAPVFAYGVAFWGQWDLSPAAWESFSVFLAGTSAVVVGALGFAGLLYTVFLQQAQLTDLSQESKTREVEQHLDRLLRTLSEILNGTDIRSSGAVVAAGRDAYRSFYRRKLAGIYKIKKKQNSGASERELVRESFDALYSKFGSDFGHYFRTLYHAVLAVHGAELSLTWKKKQMDLIFCRLSKFELALLAYNCLGTKGEQKFKPLVERYGLLEHLDQSLLLDKSHAEFFTPSSGVHQ